MLLLPLDAGEADPLILSPRELDDVTAGGLSAETVARAFAAGPEVATIARTDASITQQKMDSVSLRQVTPDLAIVTSRTTSDVDVALASAEARAEGQVARASCRATVSSTNATLVLLRNKSSVQRPGFAACSCATFGVFSRSD